MKLQPKAIEELVAAADAISSPADLNELAHFENSGRIGRLTLLRAQIEWVRHELLESPSGAAIISGLDPDASPSLRKTYFGIVSSLLGPVIRSRFDYLQSFHTDGVHHHPDPPRYLGWSILGQSREQIRFEVISARQIEDHFRQAAPHLLERLFQPFPFDPGVEAAAETRAAANSGLAARFSGQAPAHRTLMPILSAAGQGPTVRFERPSIERGFRSLGIDSRMFEAASSLFSMLDGEIRPSPITVMRGELLFLNNHRLLHSREPVTGRNCSTGESGDTLCRSWIGTY